jgi:DNA-binding transcriptional regulator GbsR (MarR family)
MTAERFIHSYSRLLASWGMPMTAARVFAYLILQPQPVGLDRIAADMGISKASAWGATRHLEQVNQVERFGEPGSKRALFAPTENFARALLNYSRLLSKSGTLMREAAPVAAGPEARARMLERAEFFLAVHEAIEATMAELTAERRRSAAE